MKSKTVPSSFFFDLTSLIPEYEQLRSELLSQIFAILDVDPVGVEPVLTAVDAVQKHFSSNEKEMFQQYGWTTSSHLRSHFTFSDGTVFRLPLLSSALQRLNLAEEQLAVEISVTAPFTKLRIHRDQWPNKTAINFPLIFSDSCSLAWFADGPNSAFGLQADTFVRSYVLENQDAQPVETVAATRPLLIDVFTFHRVVNQSEKFRLTAIIRPKIQPNVEPPDFTARLARLLKDSGKL